MLGAPDELDKLYADVVKQYGIQQGMELFYEQCDFKVARDYLADFFRSVNAEFLREGKSDPVYRTEFVTGWKRFVVAPSADTARAWLAAAPQYSELICSYIVHSCPGGKWHTASKFPGRPPAIPDNW